MTTRIPLGVPLKFDRNASLAEAELRAMKDMLTEVRQGRDDDIPRRCHSALASTSAPPAVVASIGRLADEFDVWGSPSKGLSLNPPSIH